MKYSNIGGGSFSEIEDVKTAGTKQLGRGLLQKTKQILAPAEYKGNDQIRPSNLVDYVGKHHAMALRQTISILDKIIRKPARLRDFELQAYKDRALLAHELWLLLCEQREQDIRKQNGDEAFEVFQANWRWKVHPYTDDDGNIEDFSRDQNAKYLFENKASTKERSEFEGRWHNALWKGTEAEPNYSKTADAIFSHLWKQEITIYGESKKKINDGNPEPTKIGYIEARGLYTVSSVNDPRKGKKHTPANCSVAEVKIYFKKDIVEEIAKYVHKTMEAEGFLSKLEF
ncbi:MAG: hypothetical protein GY761_19635, partial [Hyphomicrobiales bacterium]|nr:hypothetical protein [Hyphomicrobiales bacterium]